MALPETLQGLIEAELVDQGFVLTGPHAMASKMAAAIASAVISYLETNMVTPFNSHTHTGDGGPAVGATSVPIVPI